MSFEDVEDVEVDDGVVIKADVSEEVAGFFIADSWDVLCKPVSSFLVGFGVYDGGENVFF